ncbi:protein krasavietz-like [Pollicipes pollicipes]|uniref:protein krasavietz-like n=1 Tax=Pollicipes pollicipes TaxID=41117 RepID=UPI0018853B6A|nr:protein krasavietz-like [Pollicipes pollicipes]
MSTKVQKPVIQGQRIKTRKRDEKVKHDPVAFRDSILRGFAEAGADLDALSKYLDTAGNKLDYKHYGETLFDVLIAGGILAPGGSVLEEAEEGKPYKTDTCVFQSDSDLASLSKWAQVFTKLIRRYKYLEKMFKEEIGKIMSFVHGFSDENRTRLARMMVLWIADGHLPPSVLQLMLKEHLVKDMVAANFIVEFFVTWLKAKDMPSLKAALKKGALEHRLMEFLPANKQTEAFFTDFYKEKGLSEIVNFQKQQASKEARKDLQTKLAEMLNNDEPRESVITQVKELTSKLQLGDPEVITIVWPTVMSVVEWNKKEELVVDQAIRHLREYIPLLKQYTESSSRAQMTLILRAQEYCYENMNLMKTFSKIIILFYKADVLHEEVILRWYQDTQEGKAKGKTVFLEQMKGFIDWLKNAEEEDSDEEEDD